MIFFIAIQKRHIIARHYFIFIKMPVLLVFVFSVSEKSFLVLFKKTKPYLLFFWLQKEHLQKGFVFFLKKKKGLLYVVTLKRSFWFFVRLYLLDIFLFLGLKRKESVFSSFFFKAFVFGFLLKRKGHENKSKKRIK